MREVKRGAGYSEELASRVRKLLARQGGLYEIKMFGGIAFMVKGHMCCGVVKDRLMVRVGPEAYEKTLRKPHARPMDFTGRPLKGLVFVSPAGTRTGQGLSAWVGQAARFVRTLPPR